MQDKGNMISAKIFISGVHMADKYLPNYFDMENLSGRTFIVGKGVYSILDIEVTAFNKINIYLG